jgi:hypothetical protein
MSFDKIAIKKLIGSGNYLIWSLCIAAFLTKEGQITATISNAISDNINNKAISNIQLLIKDGPLLQI